MATTCSVLKIIDTHRSGFLKSIHALIARASADSTGLIIASLLEPLYPRNDELRPPRLYDLSKAPEIQ